MNIGGIMLGAGMELHLAPGDYRRGDEAVRFTVVHIERVCTGDDEGWVTLTGMQQPGASSPWRWRRLQVRVAALARALVLGAL